MLSCASGVRPKPRASAVSPCGRVGWRGREPLRSSIRDSRVRLLSFLPQGISRWRATAGECLGVIVYVWFRFFRRGFLGGEPPQAFGWRGYAACRVFCRGFLRFGRNDKSVRNLLSLPPRGKVDCRSIAKARRMRGKRRYVFIRFYSPHASFGSLTLALVPPSPKGEGSKAVSRR